MGHVRLVEEFESPDVGLFARSVSELQPAREEPRQPKPQPNHRETLLELMFTIAKIMGLRVQLFFVFLVAAGLGAYAVYRADTMALVAFGMYAAMVWLPMLWVAFKRG